MFAINVLNNVITGKCYTILTSPKFTIKDYGTNASRAFYHYYNSNNSSHVCYRGVPIANILNTIYEVKPHETHYMMITGYLEDTDEFVFLQYENKPNIEKECCICLESMSQDIPIRLYGRNCFHDIHLHCLNNMNQFTCFPCCKHNTQLTTHSNITKIIYCKLTMNIFSENCLSWKDIKQIKNTVTDPEHILKILCSMHPYFIKFCQKPYHDTVDSFHFSWQIKSRNKIIPV